MISEEVWVRDEVSHQKVGANVSVLDAPSLQRNRYG
jgi:hypothetical protein